MSTVFTVKIFRSVKKSVGNLGIFMSTFFTHVYFLHGRVPCLLVSH